MVSIHWISINIRLERNTLLGSTETRNRSNCNSHCDLASQWIDIDAGKNAEPSDKPKVGGGFLENYYEISRSNELLATFWPLAW